MTKKALYCAPLMNTASLAPAMIKVEGLHKSYGDLEVLKGINLMVPAGSILALLGPNGAGKTTLIRILTTLLKPDKGRAEVAFYDVVKDAKKLRGSIGLAGQYAAVDENLTGFENIELVGRLYHLSKKEAKKRAEELLERFDLMDASSKTAKQYSGGMRRRLDLAASLVAKPQVLFLDEPTTGLDPQSRNALWTIIQELVAEGTTVLLTTQYMEEADELAHSITVIDHGQVIAEGTSDQLKSQVGGDILEIEVADKNMVPNAAVALSKLEVGKPKIEPETYKITLAMKDMAILPEAIRLLDHADVKIKNMAVHRPTMDDVFLALTGHRTGN